MVRSGTTHGKPKFVPFNDELMESTMQIFKTSFAFRNSIQLNHEDIKFDKSLFASLKHPRNSNGKALQFIYSSKQFKTKGGLTAGTATTNVYRNAQFKKTMKAMQTPCCSPDEPNYSPSIRTAIARLLKPDPELADTIYSKCVGLSNWYGLIQELFPNTKYIYGIMTGSMEPYLKKLRHYAGEIPLLSADYGSSEGWIGANVNPTLPPELATFAVLPDIGYFEFIPLKEDISGHEQERPCKLSAEPQPVGLTEVKVGEEYEIILTNFAGLYRYRLGDVVKVKGFHNSTPELQFVCRRNLLLTVNIDKNTEKDLQLAVEAAAKLLAKEKLEVVDFTSRVDFSTEPGHYVIFWEISGEPRDEILQECCNCLDRSFIDAGYVSSRKVNTIGPLELRIVRRGTFHKILDHYVGLGAAVSQFKTPRCVGPTNATVLQILSLNGVKSYFSTAF
ncbi:UNVERIFIED_CONTAM: Jasmonoyl--L-amino acid synthetase JAR4 [Sesamum latifolium]|uniref:Jasmonoyl--L-amino acid synthetase JAR4 n=1 Tax=Sesamum latifolium TaxID=2727402 RepID=A0AAW2YGJ9_9LAMI